MSRENVEVARLGYEEFNEAGLPPLELFHPDAEFDASRVMPDVGVVRGPERFLAAFDDYISSFEDFSITVDELLDAGDRVVAVVRDGGHLKGSDSPISNRYIHVWTFRDGKVAAWDVFTDRAEALEAVGLRE
jgi:ketosteroid isomerase-like protein